MAREGEEKDLETLNHPARNASGSGKVKHRQRGPEKVRDKKKAPKS